MAAHKTNRPRSAARAEPEESLYWPHPNPLAIAAAAGNALRCTYTHPDYRWTVYTVDAIGYWAMVLCRLLARLQMHFTAALLISECGVKAKANSSRGVTKGEREDGGMTKGSREGGGGKVHSNACCGEAECDGPVS